MLNQAMVQTNNIIWDSFSFERGTCQGLPPLPSLFALAPEPLARLILDSQVFEGWRVGPLEEKISLYADDTLLYLHDAHSSLQTALAIFYEFGKYLGKRIK